MVVTSPSAAPPAAAPDRPHPTYTNMITYALAELGGASDRSAIAGFIAARFTGLPVSHDALLSAHLRRLVTEGVLCTSGLLSSYFFSSDHHHSPTSRRPPKAESNSPDLDSDDQSGFHLQSSSSDDDDDAYTPLLHVPLPVPVLGEKRGRGRPRKTVAANAGGVRRPRGRPRKVVVTLSAAAHTTTTAATPEPFLAKGEPTEHSGADLGSVLSLSGDAAYSVTKRGRGRPRKLQPSPSPGGHLSTGGIIKIKRGRGRPRKEDQQQSQEATKPPPTPIASSTGGIINIKRGRGRPRKEDQQSQEATMPLPTPTTSSTGAIIKIKRGRGRPRKEDQQSQEATMPLPTPTASSTGAIIKIKRGRGRPRKEDQQSQEATMPLPTPPALRRGIKVGCGRPMLAPTGPPVSVSWRPLIIIDKHPPETAARCSVDATSSVIKRPRGRPRMHRLSAEETGDATPAPETGYSMGIKRAHGWPIKENPAAISGETGDVVSAGIKIGGVQPQVEKPTAAMSAQAGDVGSTGIKRGGEQLQVEMPAAAMSAQAGDATPAELTGAARFTEAAELTGGAASTGIKRGRGRPRKDKTAAAAMPPADAGSAGIKRGRGRPRKDKPAAAMLAETQAGGDAVSTGGMKGALENPISVNVVSTGTKGALLRTENPSAGDFVSMVMKRGPSFD